MAFNIFGDAPQSLTGLLGEQATQDLQKKALTTGLINAAIGYIAQPKNQRYGSALPYIGRALIAGQEGAQGVYSGAIKDYDLQQRIAEAKRKQEIQKAQDLFRSRIGLPNAERQIITQNTAQVPVAPVEGATAPNYATQLPQPTVTTEKYFDPNVMMNEALQSGALPFEKYLELTAKQKTDSPIGKLEPQNFTPESWANFVNSGYDTTKLRAVPKKDTSFIQNYEYAVSRGYQGTPEDWQKLGVVTQQGYLDPYRQAENIREDIKNRYNYGTPGATAPTGNVSVTAGGKTYYFPDQASANKFKKSAGVK